MKTLHIYHTYHCITGFSPTGLLILPTVYFSKMDIEQTVKDLQAQNAQFQQMLLAMGKGKEDLTALLLEDKKKKSKKAVRILNLRRRPKTQDLATPSNTEGSLEEDHNVEIVEEEADYSEGQYPLVDDKYKELEDRLSAMEIQQIPGLDVGDLGLVSGLVIPSNFKVPTFALYDGVSCPKMHLKSYVCKIQP